MAASVQNELQQLTLNDDDDDSADLDCRKFFRTFKEDGKKMFKTTMWKAEAQLGKTFDYDPQHEFSEYYATMVGKRSKTDNSIEPGHIASRIRPQCHSRWTSTCISERRRHENVGGSDIRQNILKLSKPQ